MHSNTKASQSTSHRLNWLWHGKSGLSPSSKIQLPWKLRKICKGQTQNKQFMLVWKAKFRLSTSLQLTSISYIHCTRIYVGSNFWRSSCPDPCSKFPPPTQVSNLYPTSKIQSKLCKLVTCAQGRIRVYRKKILIQFICLNIKCPKVYERQDIVRYKSGVSVLCVTLY